MPPPILKVTMSSPKLHPVKLLGRVLPVTSCTAAESSESSGAPQSAYCGIDASGSDSDSESDSGYLDGLRIR